MTTEYTVLQVRNPRDERHKVRRHDDSFKEVMGQAIRAINAYLRPGQLRHTYTTNLLSHGAAPKDVQELLGHSDVSTTMNIYAHATREAKRTSARLLDKVVGTA